jgi:CHAT domain-containing protein/Tfp pilus assembly protein PilF
MRRALWKLPWLLAGLTAAAAGDRAGDLVASTAAAVLSVEAGSRAARAGVLPGDRIERWDGAAAELDAVLALEEELAGVRDVDLALRRADARLQVRMPQGDRGWEPGPDWTPEGRRLWDAVGSSPEAALQLAAALEDAGEAPAARWCLWRLSGRLAAEGRATEASALAERLAALAESSGDLAWRLRALLARAEAEAPLDPEAAAGAYAAAEALAREQGTELGLARILAAWQDFEGPRGNLRKERELAERALELRRRLAPESLDLARSWNNRGIVAYYEGDLRGAKGHFQAAYELRARLDPASRDLAKTVNNLASVQQLLGDFDAARRLHEEALQLRQSLAPGSADVADSLNNLGNLTLLQGDLQAARRFYERSLEIRRRLDPDGHSVAVSLNNLSLVDFDEGDVESAQRQHLEALAILERVAPESLETAKVLNNLGIDATRQGDEDGAAHYHQRALALQEKLAPESLDVVLSLINLGGSSLAQGDLDEARQLFERALGIQQRAAPQSLELANVLQGLSNVLRHQGELERAAQLQDEALELRRRLAPGSVVVAYSLFGAGELAWQRGEPAKAREALLLAGDILEQRAPHSRWHARVLHLLGRVEAADARPQASRARYERAVEVIEAQRERIGGEEGRTFLALDVKDTYHDLVAAQAEAGELALALQTLERSRARVLLERIGERRIDWASRVPEALRRRIEVQQRRRRVLDRELASAADEDVPRLRARYAELRVEDDAVAQEARRSAPGYAAVVHPQPLRAGQLASALRPGTLLLAFSVGEHESWGLAALRDEDGTLETRAHRAGLGREQLGLLVERLRRRLEQDAAPDRWLAAGAPLYAELIEPFEAQLVRARRLLVVPDGPLHVLPFAALGPASGAVAPLLQRLGVTVVPSVTVYRELRDRRPAVANGVEWVGIGAPVFGPAVHRAVRALAAGTELVPLPGARRELELVGRLFGRAELFLGAEATEQRVRSLPPRTEIVHLATHGLTDERFPMSSALALSADGDGNDGLLQAWEVYESLRLDAALVVLSACSTGTGHLRGGEGLIGLSRAFLFAGARSLLVSLWPVADETTPRLMETFYRGLLAGLDKDEALRRAQLELLGTGPRHWAAFQIVGDESALRPAGRRQHWWPLAVAAAALAALAGRRRRSAAGRRRGHESG